MAPTRQDRIIASILCGNGLLGLAWTLWVAWRLCFPGIFLWPNAALALCGIVAGAGIFLRQAWAYYLAALFYLVQTLHVSGAALHFSFTLGLDTVLLLDRPGLVLGVNLLAAGMFLWILFRIGARRSSS